MTMLEELRRSGIRQLVVIGSGATAATLIPALADQCAHVTMLQRTPTYFAAGRNADALAEELRARVAKAALGGDQKSRDRHTGRGKLLPRDRVEHLLDPGSPFLEIGQLAACDLFDDLARGQTALDAVLAQLAAEGKPRALILVPATLRAQWREELRSKFGLDADVVDGDTCRAGGAAALAGHPGPLPAGLPGGRGARLALASSGEAQRGPASAGGLPA